MPTKMTTKSPSEIVDDIYTSVHHLILRIEEQNQLIKALETHVETLTEQIESQPPEIKSFWQKLRHK